MPPMPMGNSASAEIWKQAMGLYGPLDEAPLRASIADKTELLGRYDVPGIDRVVSILPWGRSGSLLLASYFDGHDDVLTLPELCAWRLHEFFSTFPDLTWDEKLLAYPAFRRDTTKFFDGEFAISPSAYYAAVEAIAAQGERWPPEFRASWRAFFVLVHVAYSLALGRKPATARPLIVYGQHDSDAALAQRMRADFPEIRFLHTVRDPVATCDASFHSLLPTLASQQLHLPHAVLDFLIRCDAPQSGVEALTRAVRFEDLHVRTVDVMRDLAAWVGLEYSDVLLQSTFNGVPYVVARDGIAWSGQRLLQAERKPRYFSDRDQLVLSALFYENFRQWGYEVPANFSGALVRLMTAFTVGLLPTTMERTGARLIYAERFEPALRERKPVRAVKSIMAVVVCRAKVFGLVASAVVRRCLRRPMLLSVRFFHGPANVRVKPCSAVAETANSRERS